MEVLRNNIKTRSAQDYRISYVNHLTRFWSALQDTSGITALKKVYEMKKIEIDYFGPRDTKFDVTLQDDVVVIPRHWVEHVPGAQVPEAATPAVFPRLTEQTRAGFRMQGGRMRLL
jgi:hypothetical protein